jgi:hypothetical protein
LKVNQRFGGTCRLHLQVEEQAKQETSVKAGGKQGLTIEASHVLSRWFLAWLILRP